MGLLTGGSRRLIDSSVSLKEMSSAIHLESYPTCDLPWCPSLSGPNNETRSISWKGKLSLENGLTDHHR